MPKNKRLRKIMFRVCLRCGYEWQSKVEHPKRCPGPKCKSQYWDKPVTKTGTSEAMKARGAQERGTS